MATMTMGKEFIMRKDGEGSADFKQGTRVKFRGVNEWGFTDVIPAEGGDDNKKPILSIESSKLNEFLDPVDGS